MNAGSILLLGEFSGFYHNLSQGFRELGWNCSVAGSLDGFKKIPVDLRLDFGRNKYVSAVSRRILPWYHIDDFKNYDVVQVINPFVFYSRLLPNRLFFEILKRENRSLFLSAAGDDAFFWKYARSELRYGPFDDFLKYDLNAKSFFMEKRRAFEYNKCVAQLVDGIIPVMFEYEVGYRNCPNVLPVVPLPINVSKVEYSENIVQKKLVIFHGLNRYGFKGTRHVLDAFDRLKKKYPSDLELVCEGGMALEKYLKCLGRSNVVIDQLNTYSVGMNGLYSLAMGKVVLGGAEKESLDALDCNSSPVINVLPESNAVYDAVVSLLDRRSEFRDMGFESRRFVERVHGHTVIAKRYLELWGLMS